MKHERGFTIPEILIAIVLLVGIGVATLAAMRGLTNAVERRSTAHGGAISMEQQITKLRGDADTAFAVFVPTNDVFGKPNVTDPQVVPPHEVDFYTKTDTATETFWAYRYDAKAQTLQRFDYDPAKKQVGVFNRTTGAIETAGAYPPLTGVTSFSATTVQANDLGNPQKNTFASIITGLGRGQSPRGDPVGFVPASGVPRSDLYGGNASVVVKLATDRGDRTLHLVSGAMASGFTIHKALSIRSLIYRRNTHHRSWFGLVSKTRAHVFEQLQYRLGRQPGATWKVWCDYEVYGPGQGMDLSDDNRNYHPKTDFNETTGFAYFIVTHNGVLGQDPKGCHPEYPSADSSPAAKGTPAPIDVADKPPSCFALGQCWPDNAPPNWTPPSPWPSSSPPVAWCAGHQQSPLCGGSGIGPAPTPNYGTAPPVHYYSPPPATVAPISGTSPNPLYTGDPGSMPTEKPVRGPITRGPQ
ncbi:MAG: type II secretion system GspH family protein [Candidatus Eremiobacteraeota bacterium]|nr:type II secretion system GspH family protein [Candidatus Eremiobacteraeota bacterium]